MMTLLRLTCLSASAIRPGAALLVAGSMLVAARAPQSTRFWIIRIAVSVFFATAGLLRIATYVIPARIDQGFAVFD